VITVAEYVPALAVLALRICTLAPVAVNPAGPVHW
jgi:hypothetical protein